MTEELKSPILLKPIPKQQVAVGAAFQLDLNDYIENSLTEEESEGEDPATSLLYAVEIENGNNLPADLDYTITGIVYGQLRPPALDFSPYKIAVTVSNGSAVDLITSFELEVLPALRAAEEWAVDESLVDEFADAINLNESEEQELLEALRQETTAIESFSAEKQAIWRAILQGQSIPALQALLDRPIGHHEVYHLLSRMAYFVIWDANNPAPAGALQALSLQEASEHFNIYDRGACVVATPKQLFDHDRTLLQAVKTAQAMAREVFQRGWKVEFGGFDKMVRAAWVEFEFLSQKFAKPMQYSYFQPSSQDRDTLNQVKGIRLN